MIKDKNSLEITAQWLVPEGTLIYCTGSPSETQAEHPTAKQIVVVGYDAQMLLYA